MINLIVATTYYPAKDMFIIGLNKDLPHTSHEDMERFRKLTTGQAVVMGRKTYDSLGKALPDRDNYVLTRQEGYELEDAQVLHSWEEIISLGADKELWIIGGGEVYDMALELDIADKVYVSEMRKQYNPEPYKVDHRTVMFGSETDDVTYFPRIAMERYKALYIEQFEDHTLKLLSKNSLVVL